MIDNLKSKEELEVKKLKVTKADIVVKGNVEKPYYVIVYHEVGKDYDNEGFGSYYLENVFKWRDEEFEIVDENEQPKTDWIPCEERLPELDEGTESFKQSKPCLVAVEWWDGEISESVGWYNQNGFWSDDSKNCKVIAWQPFQPYKKEGAENGIL